MVNHDVETRVVSLVDIPFVRRISEGAVVLDSEMEYTRKLHGPSGMIFSGMLMPQRNLHTVVARSEEQQVVGQFRTRSSAQNAHIVYVAPHPGNEDSTWLHVLDAMAREAGKQNAYALIGEVEEGSPLFETMRTAGFAVYTRQQIWRRLPGDYPCLEPPVALREIASADEPGIQNLIAHTTPRLLQQVTPPIDSYDGWIYQPVDRVEAYIAVTRGKNGVYMMPYINPDIMAQAPAIIHEAVNRLTKAGRLPVYVRVRRHQDWMTTALEALQFEPGPRQAVMVRHLTAMVRQPRYKLARQGMKMIPSTFMVHTPLDDEHHSHREDTFVKS